MDEEINDNDSDWLERRGITDERILTAMRKIPREPFYDGSDDGGAHSSRLDRVTITPPEVIARMIAAMDLPEDATVLQVGTGSGYIPALLADMSKAVFTTETNPDTAKNAAELLQKMDVKNVQVLYGATLNDYAANGPYQAILVSAGMARIPDRLARRLSIGGVLVAPVGAGRRQQLVRLTRTGDDDFRTEVLGELRVMPLLGDILVEMGIVDREDVEIAALEADVGGKLLGEALLDGKNVKESDIYAALAKQRDIMLLEAREALQLLDLNVVVTIPRAFLIHNRMIPIHRREGVLRIASTDPTVDPEELAVALGIQMLELCLITPTDFELVWQAIDSKSRRDAHAHETAADLGNDAFVPLSADTIANFERILHEAIQSRASDVHFEREEDRVRLRLRIDGELREFNASLTPDLLAEIVHLVKVSARMGNDGLRIPRSGHFQRRFNGLVYNILAKVMPGMFGEHVTLRILPQDADILSMAELGFLDGATQSMKDVVTKGRGLIVVVGDSGAGRSTTMYSLLETVDGEKYKIAAVEYPVAYALDNVQQIRVDPSIQFGMEEAVEAALSSDIDVLLIGELNSARLAELAIEGSRGGLLVLTTVLGRDVIEAFDRFEEYGISKYTSAREFEAVIAQRLVKRVCLHCRQPAQIDETITELFGDEEPTVFEGLGCTQCSERGTRGRVAVSEFLCVTAEVGKGIINGEYQFENADYVSYRSSACALLERGTIPPSELKFLEL